MCVLSSRYSYFERKSTKEKSEVQPLNLPHEECLGPEGPRSPKVYAVVMKWPVKANVYIRNMLFPSLVPCSMLVFVKVLCAVEGRRLDEGCSFCRRSKFSHSLVAFRVYSLAFRFPGTYSSINLRTLEKARLITNLQIHASRKPLGHQAPWHSSVGLLG